MSPETFLTSENSTSFGFGGTRKMFFSERRKQLVNSGDKLFLPNIFCR